MVSAPAKLKTGRELQLPSMSQLTSKTSGQQFFLRILKVILQLREAARVAGTKSKKSSSSNRGRGMYFVLIYPHVWLPTSGYNMYFVRIWAW